MVSKRYFQYKKDLMRNNNNLTGHLMLIYVRKIKVIMNRSWIKVACADRNP